MTKPLWVVLVGLVAVGLSGCATSPVTPVPDDGPAPQADAAPLPADADADTSPEAGSSPPSGPRPSGSSGNPRTNPTAGSTSTASSPTWSPLADSTIHPGMMTFTAGSQCTANFVFYAANGTGWDLYVGQAAHCASLGTNTDTNGCITSSQPLGTDVDLGTGNPGTLAYSSWIAMQDANTPDTAPECSGNDFALIRIADADEADVSPEVPFFGGPTALADVADLLTGDSVYSFGNSGLRQGVEPVLAWKHGLVVTNDDWLGTVYTATPGIPGDSGSGFMTADGSAWGVLSTVAVTPLPLSNNVSGLVPALAYMDAAGGPDVELGTAPWIGGLA